MTDQPRDLAAEVERIRDKRAKAVYQPWIGADEDVLLQHIAALTRELEGLRRPVEQSAEIEAIRAEWGDSFVMPEVGKLLSALDQAQRDLRKLGQANQNLSNRCATLGEEIGCAGITADKLQAEIARLSSPPPERKDIAERQTAYRDQLIASDCLSSVSAEAAVRDIDTLLQDLARARNALDDRVRMLGIVQDSLSERNRQNVELQAKCERLEADNKRLCDVDSENAGLEYGLDEADIECAELRQRIERLQGALRETLRKWVTLAESGDAGEWDPEKEPHVIASRAALTASQHTTSTSRLALRDLVDRVWNEATESEQVPSTDWADRIIDKWLLQSASQHTAGSGDGVAGD